MDLYEYDTDLMRSDDVKIICGVDEAGRGPLAGDVYAAAVILDGVHIEGINDSKKISAAKREMIYDEILSKSVTFSVGVATVEEIEALNILGATMLAMKRAVEGLSITPQIVYIDGNRTPKDVLFSCKAIVKGDGKSASIAAASIVAKVSRDRYMMQMAQMYPEYEFERHKGYGTKLHYEKIREFGVSPIHRKSFLKNILIE